MKAVSGRSMSFVFDPEAIAELPPVLQRYVIALYHRAWAAYRKAGCPFGSTDSAMLLWFEFRLYTTIN